MRESPGHILSLLPRRRPQHWRYVSPHRRSAGVVILALLTLGVLAYWLVPRMLNGWTRELAVGYLGSLTGGRTAIDEARFSLFGGIELCGVSIDVPDSPRGERFLQADTILLRHRPWSLLSKGRLEPTEIVCIAPTVTLEYDAEEGRYAAEKLIAAARRHRGAAGTLKGRMPAISIRDVHLRLLSGETRVNISMVPTGRIYRITLEERRAAGAEPLRGTWRLDLATGRVHLEESQIPKLALTDGILPERYAKWRREYDIRGKVVLKGAPATAPAKATLEADLAGVSLRLRPAEGGLQLEGVHGRLAFDDEGVSARKLTGRIPQAGDAEFRMSGRYGGYDANSPFDLHINVQGMIVPDGSGAKGWLADTLKFLTETFRPTGKLDIAADFRRLPGGRTRLTGTVRPLGMSFLYRYVPYRLDQVTGTIRFTTDPNSGQVYLTNVTGRHGPAKLDIQGEIDMWRKGYYDVDVIGTDLPLDAELHRALPENVRGIWETFRPTGSADATVHVRQTGPNEPMDTQVTVAFDGRAAAAWRGFPYRLEGLNGRVHVANREVTIDSLRARRGSMHCTIDGMLSGLGGARGRTDLTIEATNFPLDANLVGALPAGTREAAASLHATGRAERVTVRLRQSPGKAADLRVSAELRDASFCPDALPYRVDDVSGLLTIRPGRLVIEELAGRHGRSDVKVTGQLLVDGNSQGVDLRVRAAGVQFNRELLGVLPAGLKPIWRRLSPGGQADVDLSLRHNMPETQRKLDYTLVLQARGMAVRYEGFPYTLRDMVGRAVATPDGVTLTNLIASHGKARLIVDGGLSFGPAGESASLSIRGARVPIDKELLDAVPASLAPLAKRFRPGGTCDLDLKEFRISQRAPAGAAAPRPASAPAGPQKGRTIRWSAAGSVAFQDATIDVGLGHKTLSGSLVGSAAQTGPSLSLGARIALDSVQVGRQRLTKLRGQLTKQPGSQVMRLDDLSADAHGGRVAGFAEIRLVEPLEYGVSLSVDGVQLRELFNAGVTDPRKRLKVAGLLTGNVQLTAAGGVKVRRQASGVLRISEGKLYRLPVMLGLLHVVYLSLPGDSAFTDGELTYHLRNDMLVFNEIYLRGPAMSIVGSGTMNMKTEVLDLTFLSGPPRKLPRLGSLGELLEGIAREVAEIQVSGTLQKPRMRTVPLRRFDRLLRDLLNPGGGR